MTYGNWTHSYTGRHNWTKAVKMIKRQGASKVNLKVKVVPTGSFGTKAVTSGTFTLKACDIDGNDYATGSVDSRDIPEIKPGDVFEFTVENVEVDKLHRISFDRPALAGDTKFDFNAFVTAFPVVESSGGGPLASWTVTRSTSSWMELGDSGDYIETETQIIEWCLARLGNKYHVVLEMEPHGDQYCNDSGKYGTEIMLGHEYLPAIELVKSYSYIKTHEMERRLEGDFVLTSGDRDNYFVHFYPPCDNEGQSDDITFTISFYEA